MAKTYTEKRAFRACRVDANQPEIVDEFRKLGCSVEPTHWYADGFPDCFVGVAGFNILVEIKNGKKPPSARKLTKFEAWWALTWQGQVIVVKNVEEVRALVSAVRRFARQVKACNIPLPGTFMPRKK